MSNRLQKCDQQIQCKERDVEQAKAGKETSFSLITIILARCFSPQPFLFSIDKIKKKIIKIK